MPNEARETHEQGVHPISRHCCSQQLACLWKRTDAAHDVPAVQLASATTQAMPQGGGGDIQAQGNFVVPKLLGVADTSSLTDVAAMTDGLSVVPAVQLANGITQAMPDGAIHAQGNFVVLKLLEVAEPIDCMSLAGALLPAALRITGEKNKTFHGLEIMLKLVFKIVSSNSSPLEKAPSATCAGRL